MSTLKNWWLQIIAVLLTVLDYGFDIVSPILEELNIPDNWIKVIKTVFVIYAVIKSKKELPTQNADKLIQQIGTPNVPKGK